MATYAKPPPGGPAPAALVPLALRQHLLREEAATLAALLGEE